MSSVCWMWQVFRQSSWFCYPIFFWLSWSLVDTQGDTRLFYLSVDKIEVAFYTWNNGLLHEYFIISLTGEMGANSRTSDGYGKWWKLKTSVSGTFFFFFFFFFVVVVSDRGWWPCFIVSISQYEIFLCAVLMTNIRSSEEGWQRCLSTWMYHLETLSIVLPAGESLHITHFNK